MNGEYYFKQSTILTPISAGLNEKLENSFFVSYELNAINGIYTRRTNTWWSTVLFSILSAILQLITSLN